MLFCLLCVAILWTVQKNRTAPDQPGPSLPSQAAAPAGANPRQGRAEAVAKPAQATSPEPAAAPAHESRPAPALLAGATRLETRVQPLPDTKQVRERRLWQVPHFKYPLIREEILREAEGGRVLDRQFVVADHALMKFPAGMTTDQVQTWAEKRGWKLRRSQVLSGIHLVAVNSQKAPALEAVEQLIASFEADFPADPDGAPPAHHAEPDSLVFAETAPPNDPSYAQLWGLHNTGSEGGYEDADIDAPEAWAIHKGSRAVVVGVIDSGLDIHHPDLAANVWRNPDEIPGNGLDDDGNGYVDDLHGWDFYSGDALPNDDDGHGTHVAGTLGAVGGNGIGITGVAQEVSLAGLRILGSSGTGTTSDAVEAVAYATFKKMPLTSNSWTTSKPSFSLQGVIAEAGVADILFVAAAGNDGRNTDLSPRYPASFPVWNIISVAATTRRDLPANYSNLGLVSVDLAAPGSEIYSTLPGNKYGFKSGSSMATPHVSGALAVLKAYNPYATAAELKEGLLTGVDPVTSLMGKCATGGRLNLHRMLQNATAASPEVLASAWEDSAGGNGDGIFNPGENLQLRVTLMNRGTEASSGIRVRLELPESASGVQLMVPEVTLGSLQVGEVMPITPLALSVAAGAPTPQSLAMRLIVSHGLPEVSLSYDLPIRIGVSSRFAGRVTDAVTGQPLADAEVHYSGPLTGSVETGPDGRYQAVVEEGVYEVWAVQKPSYARSPKQTVSVPPEQTDVDFTLGLPRLQTSPAHLHAELISGDRASRTLRLTNAGTGLLEWNLQPGEATRRPLVVAGRNPPSKSYMQRSMFMVGSGLPLEEEILGVGGRLLLLRPPITAASLKGVSLFIVDDGMELAKPAEWAAIHAAVTQGMNVIVTPQYSLLVSGRALLDRIGVTLAEDKTSTYSSTFLDHPVTSGILAMGRTGRLLYVAHPGRAIGLDGVGGHPNRHAIVVSQAGAAKFACLSDGLITPGERNLSTTRKRLMRQLLDWMSEPPVWWSASLSAGDLAPGGTQEVTVHFHGEHQAGGTYTSSLVVRDVFQGQSITLPLTMTVKNGAGLQLQQEMLEFPDTLVGHESRQTLTFTNRGDKPLTLRGLSLPNSAFQLTHQLPLTLTPGETLELTVGFAPGMAGDFSGEILCASDDPSRLSLAVPVRAVGRDGGRLVAQHEMLMLRTVRGVPVQATLRLKNEGADTSLFRYNPSRTPDIMLEPSEGSVAPGQDLEIEVTYLQQSQRSAHAVSLNFTETFMPGMTRLFEVPAIVESLTQPRLLIEPQALDFGSVAAGAHVHRPVLLRNIGAASLTLQSASFSSTGFTLADTALPLTLPAGATRTLIVIWQPTQAGTVSGLLTLTSNDPANPSVSLPMTGQAYAPPSVHIVSDALEYSGELGVMDQQTRTVTLTNMGDVPLAWQAENEEALISQFNRMTQAHQLNSLTSAIPDALDVSSNAGSHFFNDWRRSGGVFRHTQFSTDLAGHSEDFLPYASTGLGHPQLGRGGSYFIRNHPKLFLLAADLSNAREFRVTGSLSPKTSAQWSNETLVLSHGGQDYLGLLMRNHSSSISYTDCTSSLNHLVILPAHQYLSHTTPAATNSTDHVVQLSPGAGTLFHLTFSTAIFTPYAPVFKSYGPLLDRTHALNLMSRVLSAAGQRLKPSLLQTSPSSGVLSPGQSVNVTVTALPPSPHLSGTLHTNLKVVTNDPLQPAVRLNAQLTLRPVPRLQVVQAPTDFGAVLSGKSTSQTIRVRNMGSGPLILSSHVMDGSSAFGYMSGDLTLAPGNFAMMDVQFAPVVPGSHTATLRFASNDPANPMVEIPLSGTANPPPFMAVSPSPLVIAVAAGTQKTSSLTLSNTGHGAYTWSATLNPSLGYTPPDGLPEPAAPVPTLQRLLSKLSVSAPNLSGKIPDRHAFTDGVNGFSIADGGEDMYDEGNLIFTNRSKGVNLPYSNNSIASSPVFAESGGNYFTFKSDGLFVLAADLSVSEFRIAGGLGADGEGAVSATVLQRTQHGRNYSGFVKRVHGAGSDPSVNHLIIVENNESIGHEPASSTDDDAHRVFGLENSTRLYYLLFASQNGRLVTDAETGELMEAFLDLLGPSLDGAIHLLSNKGSVQTSSNVLIRTDATSLAAGTYHAEATLQTTVNSQAVPVTVHVVAEPLLALSPAALIFPDTARNETASLNLVVENQGITPLTVNSLTLPSEVFSCPGFTPPLHLAPGASTTLQVDFHPASAGTFSGLLSIESDSFENPIKNFSINGKGLARPEAHLLQDGGPMARLRLATTEATPAWVEFTLQNRGDAVLNWDTPTPIAAWQPGTQPPLAASLSPASGSVPAGGSVILRVHTATRNLPPGIHTSEIVFHYQDTTGPSSLRLPLDLDIEASPAAILETPRLEFGPLQGGSRTLALSVMSAGSEPLTLSGITLPSNEFTCNAPFPLQLAKGERAVMTVRYTPVTDQTWDTTLCLHTNDPAQRELAVPVSATGIFPGSLQVNPGALIFHLQDETSASLSLELHNAGQRSLSWNVASVINANGPPTLEQVLESFQAQAAGIAEKIPGIVDIPGGTSGNSLYPWSDLHASMNAIRLPSSYYLSYTNGRILESFLGGDEVRHFTHKLNGLWVMAADLEDLGYLSIGGNSFDAEEFTREIHALHLQGHVGFCQSTRSRGRPSFNHLLIVQERAGLSHEMPPGKSNYRSHEIRGLAGKTRAYLVVFATSPDVNDSVVDEATFTAVMRAFLEALPAPWLKVSPPAGTLPGGGTAHLTVSALDPGWTPGTYNSQLSIRATTDPGEPISVPIPVSLNLAGNPLQHLLAHPDRPEMYALLRGDRLQVLDSLTGELRTEVPLPPATTRLALAPDGNSLWGLSAGNRQLWQRPLPISDDLTTWQIPAAGYASEGDHLAVTRSGLACITDGRTGNGPTLLQLRQGEANPRSVRNLQGMDLTGLTASRLKQELWGWSQHGFQDNRSCRLVRLPLAGSGFGKPQVLPAPLLAERADARVWLTRQEDAVFAKNHRYTLPALDVPAVVFDEIIESISPDGSLAVGESRLFDGRTGEWITSFGEASRIAAFSHDGSRLWRWSPQNRRLEATQLGAMDIRWQGQPVAENLDFGRAVVGGEVSRTLTLRNMGGLALADIALSVEGTHADEVRLQAPPAPTLARGESTTCTLTFRAAAAGLRTALLKVRSSDLTTPEVALQLTLLAQSEAAPLAIDSPPQDQLVRQGEAALFHLGVSGVGPMTFEWQKGSKRQAVTQEPTWGIPLVTASHAGDYTAKVLDGHGGSLTSAPARLVVYEPVSSTAQVMAGGNLQLAGKLWGEGGSLQWHKDGAPIQEDDRTRGSRTASLQLNGAQPADAGQYTLTLSFGGITRMAATWEVTVAERPRLLDESLGPWSVGAAVHHALAASTPSVRFKATGLPPGVKLDSTTGLLSGRPTRPGDFQVTLQALHPAGASPVVTLPVQVVALPDAVQGSFVARVDRSYYGGILSLQVSPTGACSGVLRLLDVRLPLKGSLEWQPGGSHATAQLMTPQKSYTRLGITFHLGITLRLPVADAPIEGDLHRLYSDGSTYQIFRSALQGYQSPWSAGNPCNSHVGYWNARIDMPEAVVGLTQYPQGNGHAQTIISNNGSALWTARLADGSTATASSPISLQGRVCFHVFRETSLQSLLVDQRHDVSSSPARLDGILDWVGNTFYPSFPSHSRVIQGDLHTTPAPGHLLLQLPLQPEPVARLAFAQTPQLTSLQLDRLSTTLAFDVSHRVTVGSAASLDKLRLIVTPGTGTFSGQFTVTDQVSWYEEITRTGKFSGLFIKRLNRGTGLLDLPRVPRHRNESGKSLLTAPGFVEILPLAP